MLLRPELEPFKRLKYRDETSHIPPSLRQQLTCRDGSAAARCCQAPSLHVGFSKVDANLGFSVVQDCHGPAVILPNKPQRIYASNEFSDCKD